MSQRTLNSTGNKGRFLIVDNDGKPLTSVVFNTAGLALSVILQNGTEAAITLAAAGDLLNRGKGIYEVAVPDSAYTSLGDLTLCGVITDGAVVGFPQQVVAQSLTAAAVWEVLTSGLNTVGSTGRALARLIGLVEDSSGDRLTAKALELVNQATTGDWSIVRTFQVSGGDKVPGVRMSLVGVAGKSATTGTDGIATVKTDDGTFTLRVVVPAGYEDVADSSVTINGADSTATVTLVATTVTPPTNPAKSALEILCLDETGEPEADVAVDIRIAVVPSGDQNVAYKGTKQTATSDANGVARLEAIKGAEYEYKRGKAEVWNRVTIGSGDTTSVSSFIGSP